jgi:hemoglobin
MHPIETRLVPRQRTGRRLPAYLLTVLLLASNMAMAEEQTLYKRLGGYDAISAVVGDFADRLFADPQLDRFFGGMSADTRARFKQLNVLLVCTTTGGPCVYLGRPMTTSHQGMGVTPANFDAVVAHLVAALDKFDVPENEKGELLAIIGGLRPQIVDQGR